MYNTVCYLESRSASSAFTNASSSSRVRREGPLSLPPEARIFFALWRAKSMESMLSPVVSEPVSAQEETDEMAERMVELMHQNTSDMKEIYFEDNTGEIIPPLASIEEVIADYKQEEIVAEKVLEEIATSEEPIILQKVVNIEEITDCKYNKGIQKPNVRKKQP